MKTVAARFILLIHLACLAIVALPFAAIAGDAPEARAKQVVAAIIEAYGGSAALRDVTSVAATGSITDFMQGIGGHYARYYQQPGKLRIEVMPEQGGETRILDAGRGWRGNGGALREVHGPPLQAMIYQYSYLDLPMGFVDNLYHTTYAGTREWKGRPVDVLEITLKDAPQLRLFVDQEKHLIVRVSAAFNMGMGSSELITEYEDFRPVGKVLFPFTLINYAGELKLSTINLTSILVNSTLKPELFSPEKTNP